MCECLDDKSRMLYWIFFAIFLETVAGKVDELKVLEEMRAKIAEVDPKSKACFTLSYIQCSYIYISNQNCAFSK